jgi:hypothetical protein
MSMLLPALRWFTLIATGMTGVIGAYHGVPIFFEDYGYDAGNVAIALALVGTLVATLAGGTLHLVFGARRQFRLYAGGALLLFGLAFITLNTLGYYFVATASLAVLGVGVLATRRPLEGDEHYPWLRGFYRTKRVASRR